MDNAPMLSEAARREFFGERRCTAHNRQGERCARSPVIGATTCIMHGGATPLSRQAAQRRLAALVEPAIEALFSVLDSVGPRCEHCGRSDADANLITAAKTVLDRTGYAPRMQITLQQPERNFADLSVDALITELERMLTEARAMKAAQTPAIEGEIVYTEPPVPIPSGNDTPTAEDAQ